VRVVVDADTETPVSAFLKLSRRAEQAFLLESVEGGERSARFSFLGARPRSVLRWKTGEPGDPVAAIRQALATHRAVRVDGTPPFCGGLVGHVAYDTVRLFEPRVPMAKPDELGFPDVLLMDFDEVVAFDNVRHSMHVMVEVRCEPMDDPRRLYQGAVKRIQRTLRTLARPLVDRRTRSVATPARLAPRVTKDAYLAAVERAKEYIKAGDCQQIVLAQRFDAEVSVPPFEIYRSLRRVNPSPYLFFVKDGERALVGSSPETLIKLRGGEVTLRPIAGTRPRGKTPAEDAALEAELRADPKENAEHVMLVDLGRNDVGRVSAVGSVKVTQLKTVERYSHVMHLVSEVKGRLADGLSAVDVLRAGFPAGTVSGSPKVRAMEIIGELEPSRRGPYAGAVGYFDRGGDMEMCIAIRTLMANGRRVSVQAGGGLVYDSVPEAEYQETLNKARAVFTAVAQAESRLLDAVAAAPHGDGVASKTGTRTKAKTRPRKKARSLDSAPPPAALRSGRTGKGATRKRRAAGGRS
jgi:anthranilate synthase component 1